MQFAADSCILGGAAGRPAAPAAQKRTRRGIEVVITGAPRKRFGSNPTWVRIPPSPPKQRAHAAHGPSALLLDRWDSKGGTENAAVRHFPAPGRTGKRLRRAERKQAAARAENPTLLREQAGEGPCSAWALCFAFGQVGFEGRNRKCRSAAFSRPGGAPPREPRPRPGGERAREQIRPAGGCPAGAARRAAAPCAQTSVSPPANPLRFPRHIISGVTCKSTREPSTAFTAMKSRSGSPSPRSSS